MKMGDEWIEWDGVAFAPPIDPHGQIEVRFADGSTDVAEAGSFYWQWEEPENPQDYDIDAYRRAVS
jgi:hypothetical protein